MHCSPLSSSTSGKNASSSNTGPLPTSHCTPRLPRAAGSVFAGWGQGEQEAEGEVKEEEKAAAEGSGGAAAPAPPGRWQPGAAARLVPPRRPGTSLSAGKATRRCPRWWREGCACAGSSGTGARGRRVLAAGRAGGRRPRPGRAPPAPGAGPARLRAVPRARMG